jgi:hypothetical protein
MSSKGVHQLILFENFSINPRLKEETFPKLAKLSIEEFDKVSLSTISPKSFKFKLNWF